MVSGQCLAAISPTRMWGNLRLWKGKGSLAMWWGRPRISKGGTVMATQLNSVAVWRHQIARLVYFMRLDHLPCSGLAGLRD